MPITAIKGPYLPRPDGELREWLDNFASVIARSPWSFQLSASVAAELVALAERYALVYVRANSPGTRSRVTVKQKNRVRREAWDTVRPIAMRIKRHKGIGDADKIELGIYPPLRGQSRIVAPKTAPQLEVIDIGRGVHRLRFSDPSNPSRYRKPYGAVSMELRIGVASRALRSPDNLHRVEFKTRHVFEVKHRAQDAGKTATYFARWTTRRGKTGPWSRALAVTIA